MIALLYFGLIAMIPSNGKAQTRDTLWHEDFEDANWIDRWSVSAGTWQVGVPTSGPDSAYSGLQCAATILDGNYPRNSNSRLERIQSFIVPPASQNPRLRFWHWFSINCASGYVQIKIGVGNWQTISIYPGSSGGYYNFLSGGWTNTSIDLIPYADSTVQLAFQFTDNGSCIQAPGWYIDDIILVTGPIVFNNLEGWESGLGDWYTERGTWQVGTPTSGPGSAHTAANCAATVLNGNYPGGANSRLISPSFTIPPASQNPRLRYWHWYNINCASGSIQIKVGIGNWQTISIAYQGYSGGWTNTSIDLVPYADSTVQLAFQFIDNSSCIQAPGWYIDDIEIVGMPTAVGETAPAVPSYYSLSQNYPNPFNPSTHIKYALPVESFVSIKVFNVLGREVATLVNERHNRGNYEAEFDGDKLPSGIYFYLLQAGSFVETKKLLLIR